ncbi:acyclic terpene utilization AtuA family protein [Paraburkholderia sp.]|uniref:acyclic terpene utilization AtuA family protein n=1 Tax=Paraburkholderia sp. TaxID=1926495 RepID=UPI0039E6E078
MSRTFKLVAATGMLGSGFRAESIDKAIELGAEMIGCDAGSTDSGPNGLAQGKSHFSVAAVRRDVSNILGRALKAGIPLIIGSAGTSGSDKSLASLVEIVRELAREQDLHFRLAIIHSELSKDVVLEHVRAGRSHPLTPSQPLTEAEVDESLHIVAMMGVEPIQEALKAGAQVVLAGRSSDTSIYAALPLMKGFDPAVVWHMAKILECGAAAVAVRTAPDSMMAVLHEDSFDVFPLRDDYRCTQQSVASHTLYENADPFDLKEPSGTLITRDSKYEAISDRAVNVSNSRFVPADEYTIKIEGVRQRGYSTIIPGAIRDPYIIGNLDPWLRQLDESIKVRLSNTIGDKPYEIVTRVYGRDGVMGELEPDPTIKGHEIMILWDVISESQELSHTIASSVSHLAVHNPIPKWNGLISGVAYPYSPNEINRGPVYEFHLNHVLVPDTPTSLFSTEFEEI